MKCALTMAVVMAVLSAPLTAYADAAPPPPEACREREEGDRCYDALGRAGQCAKSESWGGRVCRLLEGSAAPPTVSSPPATASAVPQSESPAPAPRSGGCSAALAPLPGMAAAILMGLWCLLGRRRRGPQ